MKRYATNRVGLSSVLFHVVFILAAGGVVAYGEETWYAGTWDSTLYGRAPTEHPKTVAIRIEVFDSETRVPTEGVLVSLKGKYKIEAIRRNPDDKILPEDQEFHLQAATGDDGVAVFALRWQKEYPWTIAEATERPRTRAVDDVEKMQRIETRDPQYRFWECQYDFQRFLDPKGSGSLFELFKQAWAKEIGRQDARFCVIRLGPEFPDYGNPQCTREEFFDAVRNKDFGTVYREYDLHLSGHDHRFECGPYLVYMVDVSLKKTASRVEVAASRPQEEKAEEHHERGQPDGLADEDETPSADTGASEGDQLQAKDNDAGQVEKMEETQRQKEDERAGGAASEPARDLCNNLLGVAAVTLTRDARKELGLYPGVKGVLLTHVVPGSPADDAGLGRDMVVYSIRHRSVEDEDAFRAWVESLEAGDDFLLGVWEQRGDRWEPRSISGRLPAE